MGRIVLEVSTKNYCNLERKKIKEKIERSPSF